jgi:lipoprotein NlpI
MRGSWTAEIIMHASGKAFLAIALTLASFGPVRATGLDDANAAVLAARDGKYDDAIQLFTNAINSDELNLKARAQAYAYRGIAKATLGDYDAAQEDLNFSVALDSDYNADAYAFRGYMALVTGVPQKAAADLAKSANLKIWAYNALWLSLARMKANIPDTDNVSLSNNAMTLNLGQWPGTVVKFMMGQAKREEVASAANEGDPAKAVERVCDADFYVGEYDLAHNDAARAKPLLQHAADKCPFASFERMGATAELKRLK